MEKSKLGLLDEREKAKFLRGIDAWQTYACEDIGIKSFRMSDCPVGLRKEGEGNGLFKPSIKTIAFPSEALLSCSFDPEVFSLLGKTIANEAKKEGIQAMLGPAMNIKRSPFCGRTFEYISEDPYLTGVLAASYVTGMQSEGVGACVKHFAVNSSEANRMIINEVVDERALREIYLSAFEHVIKETDPCMVMASYNKVNGVHATENRHLLTEILRDEWKYEGVVVSDWFAVNDPVKSILNGLNLEMPDSLSCSLNVEEKAIRENPEFKAKAEESIVRIGAMSEKYPKVSDATFDFEKDHLVAKKLAEESIVLLKNDDNILPLKREDRIAILGSFAKTPRYQGGGSSHLNSYKVDSFLDELDGIDYEYFPCFEAGKALEHKEAIKACADKDKVLLFLGIEEKYEGEGFDRFSLSLPDYQLKLVEEVKAVNPNIVVILMAGGVLSLPFISDIKGLVETYLGGEAISLALKSILYGEVNPSGHLTESFPLTEESTPCYAFFPGDRYNCKYAESIFVGYRYYETFSYDVLFPFGFGLSYSTFEYSSFSYDELNKKVSFKVKNTSNVAGKALPQIYISKPRDEVFNAACELVSFTKVYLEPGEEKTIELEVPKRAFEYFNINKNAFVTLYGQYKISLRKDSHSVLDEIAFSIKGCNEDVPYKKEELSSYYEFGVKTVTDSEFKKLFKENLPLVSTSAPIDLDSSIVQAFERGSKGARRIVKIVNKIPQLQDDFMSRNYVLESPIRLFMYVVPGIQNDMYRIVEILEDKHLLRNFLWILLKAKKLKKLLG